MKKFIIQLSDSQGFDHMLYAYVKKEEVESIKKKIIEKLVVRHTQDIRNGDVFPGKDPKILEQLKNITGYKFTLIDLRPDLDLSFSDQSLFLQYKL